MTTVANRIYPNLEKGADGRMYVAAVQHAPPGSYMPDPTNTGLLPNVKLDQHDGDFTLGTNEVISNVNFGGRVYAPNGGTMNNCKITALKASVSEGPTVRGNKAGAILTLNDCEVSALGAANDHLTYGLGWIGIHATRVYIHDVVDGFDAMLPGGDADLQSILTCCLIDRLLVGPTPASIHPDLVTHNDGVQVQGSGDLLLDGCMLRCMASPASVYAPPSGMAKKYGYPRANGSVVGITPNTAKVTRPVEVRNGWAAGGRRGIGAVAGPKGISNGMIKVHDMLFYNAASGMGSITGEHIMTQQAAWMETGNNFECNAAGVSTGVAVGVQIGTPD